MKLVQLLPRWMVAARPLYDSVTRWLAAQEDEVLVLEHRYARCELHRGSEALQVRIPAAALLSPTITTEGIAWAAERGFAFDHDLAAATWTIEDTPRATWTTAAATRRVATEIEALALHMFDMPQGAQPVLSREASGIEAPHDLTTPERFAEAMRSLAKTRSQADRKAVYEAFLNHRHLVPLSAFEGLTRPDILVDHEDPGQGEVWVSFTNWSDAKRWRRLRDEGSWAVISGVQLMALAQHLESLRVNPGSRLGGEFYGHEVRSIVEALHLTP